MWDLDVIIWSLVLTLLCILAGIYSAGHVGFTKCNLHGEGSRMSTFKIPTILKNNIPGVIGS